MDPAEPTDLPTAIADLVASGRDLGLSDEAIAAMLEEAAQALREGVS